MISDKTLLLSDGYYSENIMDPNEILLRFLTSEFEKDALYRVIFSMENLETNMPTKWNGFRYIVVKRIRQSRLSLVKYFSYFINTFHYVYILAFIVPNQEKQIKDLIKKEKFTKIWIVVTSPQLIFVTKRLLNKFKNIQTYITVWDPPEEFSLMLKMPGTFRKKMLADFTFLLNNSQKLGVSSLYMKKEYEIRFNKKCFILQGDVTDIKSDSILKEQINNFLIIGFAGTMYTPEVWTSFFEALDLVGWKINNRDVKIRIIGHSICFKPSSRCMIEYLGKLPINEVRDILSKSFFNFVPYRFSANSKYGSTVAFPSKINTYLSAKKPIFTIAPSYSSPSQFVIENDVGVACNSLSSKDILSSLKRFITSGNDYSRYITNCENVYNNSFRSSAFRRSFDEFIN